MSQIFHPSTNIWSKVSIIVAVVFIGFLTWIVVSLSWSGYVTGQGVTVEQPVQFSQAHHVGSMGIDCRSRMALLIVQSCSRPSIT